MLTSGGDSRSVLKCYFRFSPLADVRRKPRVPVSSRLRRARRGPRGPRSRAASAGPDGGPGAPVPGPQPQEVALSVESLDGDLLAAPDEGRHDGTVGRVFGFFYDQEVPVGD